MLMQLGQQIGTVATKVDTVIETQREHTDEIAEFRKTAAVVASWGGWFKSVRNFIGAIALAAVSGALSQFTVCSRVGTITEKVEEVAVDTTLTAEKTDELTRDVDGVAAAVDQVDSKIGKVDAKVANVQGNVRVVRRKVAPMQPAPVAKQPAPRAPAPKREPVERWRWPWQ